MIRPAIESDADILTAISFASKGYWNYPEAYFRIWKEELTVSPEYIQKNAVYVCESSQSVIGYYAMVFLEADIEVSGITINKGAWLDHMFIDPPSIGKGIGAQLFHHFRERCIAADIPEVGILADPNSRGFYEKMGCTYIREYPSSISGRTTPYLQFKPVR